MLELEYDDFASTSSSKHHGQKVIDSHKAAVRRAVEDVEVTLARAYATIDRGNDVADLTAPGAMRRIREMDRLGLTYETPKYLTYPEEAATEVAEREGEDERDSTEMELVEGETLLALALRRAENMPLVLWTNAQSAGALSKVVVRPSPRLAHDASIGMGPERRIEDEEKDALVADFDALGNVSDVAYRDLDGLD